MLPPIDELMAMTSDQLDALKEREYREILRNSKDIRSKSLIIQTQIYLDHVIIVAPNKFAAALKIKSLMNASLIDLNDALQGVTPK
tara:strand:+ start:28586 stop:28843 length:258 start_codon:yes stop_codon:yes gene_type:complete